MSAPLYVQVKNKQEVLETIDSLKEELVETRTILEELYALQTEENKQLHLVQQSVKQIHERIAIVEGAFVHE